MISLVYVEQPASGEYRAEPERFLSRPAPRLPRHNRFGAQGVFGFTSFLVHFAAAATIVALASAARAPIAGTPATPNSQAAPLRFIFLPKSGPSGGGGGGGGNRQRAPIPSAQAKGHDALTLPAARPIVPAAHPVDAAPPIQSVALDAKSLLAGETFQVGVPDGLPTVGTSQGPGSGGGVGDGIGTGIGSGRGPGVGPGAGGGVGGGVYRVGGAVTTPTIVHEVRPTYTPEAMRAKIQGLVVLDVVVQRDGTPGDIRIVRSLDPGLDRQALIAVRAWRFNPGRLSGVAVDVLVTIELSFRIH